MLIINSAETKWVVIMHVYVLSHFSHVWLCVTLWTVAHQAPLSMEFSMQEYWSELPRPAPRDLCKPGIEPASPALQADSFTTEPLGKPGTNYTSWKLSYTRMHQMYLLAKLLTVKLLNQYSEQVKAKLNKAVIE